MQTRSVIITTGTILALVAPTATAARAKVTPLHAPGNHKTAAHSSKGSKVTTVTHRSSTPDVLFTAPFGPTPIITPRYIYFPALPPDPNAMPIAADCASSGNNCTPEELCDLWGQC